MDLASRGGISLHLPSASATSASTPVTPDPSPSAITEKHALAATEASTIATVAESTAQVSAKEPLAKSRLSKGQRKRLRNTKKTMEKRAQSYLSIISQSMFRVKIKDLKVTSKTCLSKVNGLAGVDLAPERAAVCRRKLQSGCKADPEFSNMVTNELDRMVDSIKRDESMDSKERRRKMKAFRNIAGYHDLIIQSMKADLQPSEETSRMASVAATAAKQ
ncbi:hypothetical protein BGZ67_002809 [Mortierella alpina]|nr:hypothetical protein BGZ67_002809 [Mortierella alpina]